MNDLAQPVEAEAAARAEPGFSRLRRYYCLLILTLVATMSTLDRQIMNILLEPIRKELGLSDTEMGLLTGLAFAFVYATLCIPAARIADRWSRRKMVALAITSYSVMTILCGAARNGLQMFVARFGVGAGEACGNSSGHALVGDLFPRRERATAMTVLMLSAPVGMALGLVFGGWALQAFGWRTAFVLVGIPGLILGPLVFFTIPEIGKGMADGVKHAPPAQPFGHTLKALWSCRAFPNMIFGATVTAMAAMGAMTWLPAFLARSHGMSHAAIGAALGASVGVGSIFGHILGGPLIDWLGRRDLRWHLWVPMLTNPVAALLAATAFLAPLDYVFPLLAMQMFLSGLFTAPMIAIVMNLAPVAARATASAILGFVMNIVGMGLGPQIIGIASDLLKPAFGVESLRYALLGSTALGLVGALLYFRASLTYRADLAMVDARNAAEAIGG
jgi:MFS family permease